MPRTIRILAVLALLTGLLGAALEGSVATAAARPAVTTVGPGAGPLAPTRVLVSGQHLQGVLEVRFGTRRAAIVRRVSATAVEVRTPRAAQPGIVPVRVRTAAGWSATSTRARYAFVGVPAITRLSAATGSYAGGQRVTLIGKNLTRTTVVRFGSLRGTVLSRSGTQVVVRTPVGVLGRAAVTVTTPGGTSRAAVFNYAAPAASSAATLTLGAQTAAAPAPDWVTGGDDPGTGEPEPWVVGLPPGSAVPPVGRPFLVRPGTDAFPSGLAGLVGDVAVQPDQSVRVTVEPTTLTGVLDRLVVDHAGPVGDPAGPASSFAVDGPTALSCRDGAGRPVPFGGRLTLTAAEVHLNQRVELGRLVSAPSTSLALTAELRTTGTLTTAAAATCRLKPAWQAAHRRTVPLGRTGAAVSLAPALQVRFSAAGTWSVADRTRTTYAVSAERGRPTQLSRTSRSVGSRHGGALSPGVQASGGLVAQFGVLGRTGLESQLLVATSLALQTARGEVCATGTIDATLGVRMLLDAWVARWTARDLSASVPVRRVRGCLPPTAAVGAGQPEIVSARLPDARIGADYRARLSTADDRDGNWSVAGGALPAGLTLAADGIVSGTPTGPVGDHPVVVAFTGIGGDRASTTVRIRVQPVAGIGGGDIQVTLRWDGPADLDLHAMDPAEEHIHFGNRRAASGGHLDRDANGSCNGPDDDDLAVENVYWPPRTAPPGRYALWVVAYADCGGDLDWRLTIRRNGTVVLDQTGTGSSPAWAFEVG